jgi:hypothetical protein
MARVCSVFALVVLFIMSLVMIGCGGNPSGQLISMTITPSTAAVDGQSIMGQTSATSQFTAYGTYQNPTETRDITAQVTWSTDAPEVGQFLDPKHPGLLFSGTCGVTNVKATAGSNLMGGATTNQAVMTAFATFKVTDSSVTNEPVCK